MAMGLPLVAGGEVSRHMPLGTLLVTEESCCRVRSLR